MPDSAPTGEDEQIGPTFFDIVDRRHGGGSRFPRTVVLALALVAAVAAIAFLVSLLAPRATVALTLETIPVQGIVRFDVTDSGQPLDGGSGLAIPATPVELTLAIEQTLPTTGQRAEPDGVATGVVRFANPAPDPVKIAAGATLTTGGGHAFTLIDGVEVPGADPTTGQSGFADGQVRATEAGSGGNVDIGEIGGRLENGVYYSNREAATGGGSDRAVSVVAAADLAALDAQTEEALRAQALTLAEQQLPEGARALPESLAVVSTDDRYSAKEGEDASQVTLRRQQKVRVLSFDPAAALQDARTHLPEAFAAEIPEGFAVDPASVRFGEVQQDAAQGAAGASYTVATTAEAAADFDDADARALAERLAGTDNAEAETIVRETPGVVGFAIEYRPGWLLRRMPKDAGRIAVETTP
ncbi:MAG: hypothetical protein IT337_06045 [Thermomicrobiales bacterium]|nr:hypothetical protein [Thermomicrobiales bacterium]